MDLLWDSPYQITNFILDIGWSSNHDFENIFSQLDDLMCPFIQLRFFTTVTIGKLREIFSYLNLSSIISVELLISSTEKLEVTDLQNLIKDFPRIKLIYLYAAKKFKIPNKIEGQRGMIVLVPDKLKSAQDCGNISYNHFYIDIHTFTEGQKFNTCLNRKISIDINGEIKNCPSMLKSFGNIRNVNLKGIIKKEEFQRCGQSLKIR